MSREKEPIGRRDTEEREGEEGDRQGGEGVREGERRGETESPPPYYLERNLFPHRKFPFLDSRFSQIKTVGIWSFKQN